MESSVSPQPQTPTPSANAAPDTLPAGDSGGLLDSGTLAKVSFAFPLSCRRLTSWGGGLRVKRL